MIGMQHAPTKVCPPCPKAPVIADAQPPPAKDQSSFLRSLSGSNAKSGELFPKSLQGVFQGVSRTNRDDFHKHFDTGVPLDPSKGDNEEVLIFYSNKGAMTSTAQKQQHAGIPSLSIDEATKECDTMKVVFSDVNKRNQCFAVMGQWESYHVQKFMRLPYDDFVWGKKEILDMSLPMRHVARTHTSKGQMQRIPDQSTMNKFNNDIMIPYLQELPSALERLAPLAKDAAGDDNTVIVMVCNHGQSELLLNFVCTAKARNLDMSSIIVFATDEKTKALAEGVGMKTYYDEKIFGHMPDKAAKRYADPNFSGMMLAKVFCVHMISQLKYDFLFQDVDVVWYKNPIPYFHNTSSDRYHFDMYFQDDGAHTTRYAPYSPNSGFYYVRHNERTEFYMSQLLKQSDMVVQTGSHQTALTMVLNEQVSLRGLHVKVLSRDEPEFPGGFHFHRNKQLLQDMVNGRTDVAYIFHMSWTENKANKIKFLQQMGDWHVQDMCIEASAPEILEKSSATDVASACCSAQPLITCHYRDKPSKIPCKDAEPIDKGHASWW